MSHEVYSKARSALTTYKAIVGGGLMTAGIFLLLPLTQALSGMRDDETEAREISIYDPPPVIPPPPPELEEPPEEDPPPPEMQEPPPPISLTELNLSLTTGTGGYQIAQMANFDQGPNMMEEIVFELSDLDRVPRALRRGRLDYPIEMRRDRIEGSVRLKVIIDERGRVSVTDVISSTHREFVRPAIESAESSLFESPTRNGEKVKVTFILPVNFSM